jgi:hypothetical protein
MSGAIPPLLLYAFMAWAGKTAPLLIKDTLYMTLHKKNIYLVNCSMGVLRKRKKG